ncbi:MAG: Hpt domain-containing protein [Gemmatimonadaceae bacterium]
MDIPDHARSAVAEIRAIGDEELVAAMMGTFVRFAEAQLARLEEAAASGDFATSGVIAQTLKSSAHQLGALPFGDACADAELAGRGADASGLREAVQKMLVEFATARTWMDSLADG